MFLQCLPLIVSVCVCVCCQGVQGCQYSIVAFMHILKSQWMCVALPLISVWS